MVHLILCVVELELEVARHTPRVRSAGTVVVERCSRRRAAASSKHFISKDISRPKIVTYICVSPTEPKAKLSTYGREFVPNVAAASARPPQPTGSDDVRTCSSADPSDRKLLPHHVRT